MLRSLNDLPIRKNDIVKTINPPKGYVKNIVGKVLFVDNLAGTVSIFYKYRRTIIMPISSVELVDREYIQLSLF